VTVETGTEAWYERIGDIMGGIAYERIGIILGAIAGGAIIFALLLPIVLLILGFTSSGVLAGSFAACCQSSIGNVVAGSCFAVTQSVAAGGCHPVILIPSAVIGACLGGYIAFIRTC